MLERTFFVGHNVSKMLGFDHVAEGGEIIHHSLSKKTKYDEKPNKTWSISTVLIIIKTEGFRISEKVCFDFLNWLFGFQPKISFLFPKHLRWS